MSADGTIPEARTSAFTSSWYTPAAIVEAARLALGGTIDLDPASCVFANRTVRARAIFTEEHELTDGLSEENRWFGSVFLNPPSPPRPWWKKLRAEILSGHVGRAVFVGYSIETLQQFQDDCEWFDQWHWCIPAKRVKYETTAGERLRVLQGRLNAGRSSPALVKQIEALAKMGPSLVSGDAPAHASVVFGYGMSLDTFERAFAAVGVCR